MNDLKHPRWALALLATAQLIIALDATIIFVALHDMGRALQINAQQLQWVVSAYTVAFGGCLLLGGRAADLLGRRRFYRLGMLLFALASLLGALAPDATLLVIARAAQGVGAALLFPATLALINTLYAEGPVRNRALAIWSMASAVGLALGTLLGGVLTQAFGWPAVLAVIVPLASACAVGAGAWLPADGERLRGRSFDLGGCLTVTAGGSLLVTTLVQGPEWGWTASVTLVCLLLAVALLALFVVIETRSRDPLMQFALLRLPGLRAALGLTFAFMSSYGVQYYFLALYFQDGYGWSPLQAGLAFLLPTVVCTFGIHVAERMLQRHSPRQVLAWGFGAGAAGIATVALALPHGAGYWPLLPGIVVLSVGQGMSWTAMWIVAGQGVPAPQQGVASGMAATAQQIGGALGLAVLVMLANAARGGHPATSPAALQGMVDAQYGAALFAVLGMLIAFRLRPAKLDCGTSHCLPDNALMDLLDLRQTLDAFAACNDDHAVWGSFGWVHATDDDLLQARFWLPPDEESAFDDDGEVPAHARALGLSTYLEPATFASVLEVQKRQRPLSTLQDYAQALTHYAEYDAFLEVEGVDQRLGEARAEEHRQAREAGVGPGIFATFDLVLPACPDARIKAVAQRVARLLEVPVGEALSRCRALPLVLGEGLDRRRAQAIHTDFAALGVSLDVCAYRPFPWSDTPLLA